MADDVKVKFGGDFSGVSKGATDAASQAGSALGTAIEGKVKAIGASIAAAFAIGAVASRLWEGFKSGIAYMHELNLATSRTGQSSGEFQKLAYAGKEAGVSMDIVGRGLTEANKALKEAKGNANQRNMFAALGMDAEKLEAGTYTATDALLALADQWDKFGNETKTRAGAMAVFGRFGEGMIPVIKQGRSAIEEQTASVREQTRGEIVGAAAIEKKVAALERYTKQMERLAAATAGVNQIAGEFTAMEQSFSDFAFGEGQYSEQPGGMNPAYREKYGDKNPQQAAAEELAKKYKEQFGINAEEMAIIVKQAFPNATGAYVGFVDEFQKMSDKYVADKNKPGPKVEELAGALSASSLQAIGGGDVASVLSGTYQNDMVDLTRQIATNTKSKETAHTTDSPAKAGK
jgi:hypothetical protein